MKYIAGGGGGAAAGEEKIPKQRVLSGKER